MKRGIMDKFGKMTGLTMLRTEPKFETSLQEKFHCAMKSFTGWHQHVMYESDM